MATILDRIKGIKEFAQESINNSKKNISEALENNNFEQVTRSSINAEAHGYVISHINKIISIAEKNEDNKVKCLVIIMGYISEQALRGADDKWSGRNNDLIRTKQDYLLDAFNQIRDSISYDTDYSEAMSKMVG